MKDVENMWGIVYNEKRKELIMLDSDSKLFALACHLSLFLGLGVIVPLVIFLVKKDDEFVLFHAKQALASQLGFYVAYFIAGLLSLILIGLLILPILGIAQLIFTVIAAIKTADEEYYKYPVTGDFAEKF